MKFLLDVCVTSNVLHKTLNDLGHDVLSARDGYASASDRTLPDLAYREERVLITEDKDFGELVFSLRLPHPCIVRFDGLTTTDEASAIRNLIDHVGMVLRRLAGETQNTSPVLTLITQFGGGKTHTLAVLYHLASGSCKHLGGNSRRNFPLNAVNSG